MAPRVPKEANLMNTEQLRARLAELEADLEAMAMKDGDLDDAERANWATYTSEGDQIKATLAERAERAKFLANRPDKKEETGDGAAAVDNTRTAYLHAGDDIYDRAGLHIDNEDDGRSYRDRAMKAIDSWDRAHIPPEWKESAERLVTDAPASSRDRAVADHILRTGSPEYVRAFYKYLSNPNAINTLPEAERAALNEGTTTQGGFLVPPFLDPTIILTNVGITNPFRSIASVKSIVTQTWKGVTSAGVTAEWTAEAAEMTDASPTFAQPSITPVRADAYVQASFEVLEDTNIATELGMLFADARDRLEGTAFAVGTGSTQPFGIVTELQLITASRVDAQTNGSFGQIDVFALDNSLGPRWRQNASWLANKSWWNRTRQLATGGSPQSAFWTDLGGGRPAVLVGYSVYESSAMQSTMSSATASSDDVIILGDFKQYYIVDRIGMSVAYNPLVIGANRRPSGEVGWAAFWRVGGRTVNADAFRMLRV